MKFPTMAGIYQIKNITNNKVYIGSTVNLLKRKNTHFLNLEKDCHKNKHLQFSYNKYGKDNFIFEILEVVENKNNLIKCEQYWLDKIKSYNRAIGYNICPNAGNTLGIKISEETKKLWSEQRKGRKFTIEHRIKIAKANTGKKCLEETKNKISLANKNRKVSEETRQKMSKSRRGKKHSEETKLRMSINKSGNSNYWFGKTFTKEHKQKLSLKQQGEKHNNVKLNELQVRIIRSLKKDWKNKLITINDLSKYFNIYYSSIYKIMNNEIWTHI